MRASGFNVVCLLLLGMHGGDAKKKRTKEAGSSIVPEGQQRSQQNMRPDGMTDAFNLFEHFDQDSNGVITREEVASRLPSMTSPKDMELATEEERVDGFMAMLDENSDDVGSRMEMANFMEKMRQMDGRLDRLPVSDMKRAHSKPRKETQKAHWSEHEEL